MQTLSGSLAALAIVAARDGQWTDAARLLAQAANAPDSDQFLECQLTDNYQAACLVDSVSSSFDLAESVTALSAALELNAEEERTSALYDDDEIVSLNSNEEVDDEDLDDEQENEEDEDNDVAFIESDSSSLLRIRL